MSFETFPIAQNKIEKPTLKPEKIKIHSEMIGFRVYNLEIEKNVLEKWNTEVSLISKALEEQDFSKINDLLKNKKLIERSKNILERSNFLESDTKNQIKELLAIGIWVIDNQNNWPGNLKSFIRMFSGGSKDIKNFTKEGSLNPSCLDMSAIVKAIANFRGLKGDIKRLGEKGKGSRLEHRFWMSEKGIIVDTLWGREKAGLYLTREEYDERRKERLKERGLKETPTPSVLKTEKEGIEDDCGFGEGGDEGKMGDEYKINKLKEFLSKVS